MAKKKIRLPTSAIIKTTSTVWHHTTSQYIFPLGYSLGVFIFNQNEEGGMSPCEVVQYGISRFMGLLGFLRVFFVPLLGVVLKTCFFFC